MKLHPRFEQLQAFADEDRPSGRTDRISAHVDRCDRCRETVAWVGGVRRVAREATEVHAPAGTWERIAARVRADEEVLLPVGSDVPPGRRRSRPGRFAAAVLLLVTAGAAAAMVPGSPVGAWLSRLRPAGESVPAASPRGPDEPAPAEVSLLVAPSGGAVQLAIERPDPDLRIRVRLAETGPVNVRAAGAATDAHFQSGPGRLAVADAGPGELTVVLPRTLDRATLEVDGTRYLAKRGGRIRILVPAADTTGSEFVLPVHPAVDDGRDG